MIQKKVQLALNGYIVSPAVQEGIDNFIIPPYLDDNAGVCGAMALGQKAAFPQSSWMMSSLSAPSFPGNVAPVQSNPPNAEEVNSDWLLCGN
jgi:hypothetical protein